MSLATVRSRAQNGLAAEAVTVEVHLANGLPSLNIVGLPEAAVREAKDRVRAALSTSGYAFPQRRITIHLAPADLPKHGGRFDLAIALGILLAQGDLPAGCLDGIEVLGELSLAGDVRAVPGVLPAAVQAAAAGHRLLLPEANAAEAARCPGVELLPVHHLSAVCAALQSGEFPSYTAPEARDCTDIAHPDLGEVRGQLQAKRALEIAAAGGHSLLMVGPPGAGKSMLASRLPGLLPPLTPDEALEVATLQSVSREGFDPDHWGRRPFRAPHHTASGVALVGGGAQPRPGEISLAHRGVLFLDELPEFPRAVLDVLREPLEAGHINISRAAQQLRFPARFQLIAAMNPCPCGHLGDPQGQCRCTPDQIARYRGRLSGPLLDRIDLQLFVPRVEQAELLQPRRRGEAQSAAVRARASAARERQLARQGCLNCELSPAALESVVPLGATLRPLLKQAMTRLRLSARGLHRVLKVARTLADLAGVDTPGAEHLAEALRYRTLQ
jgi:magnesium chelatase family protein